MPEVVVGLCHGGWSAADGYVAIPENTHVYLFQEPGDLMEGDFADENTYKTPEALQAMQSKKFLELQPREVVYDYSTSPLDLKEDHPLEGSVKAGVVVVPPSMKLSEILAQYKGNNIYWLCCQAYAAIPTNEEDELETYDRLLTPEEREKKASDEWEAMKKAILEEDGKAVKRP